MYKNRSVNGLGLSCTLSGQCRGRCRFSSITGTEEAFGFVQERAVCS